MRRLVQVLASLGLALFVPVALAAQHQPTVFASRSVNPHGPDFKEPCASCHAPDAWKPVRIAKTFKHAEKTFPLTGAHGSATCASCHKTLDFKVGSGTCATCHQDVHKGELGTDCARCHTSRAFVDRSAMTRMHQLTRFPLRSAHAVVACESCHLPTRAGQMQFVKGATTCASCHAATFRSTVAPPHVEPSFSMNCTACHKTATWDGATFDHSLTLFPLSSGHKSVACADCHADKQYHGRSMECQSCHQKDYNKTTNPPHTQGFPTTCLSCHTTENWTSARFDHGQMTRFPLTGAHRVATCASCHGDKVFKGKPMDCVSCHQTQYNQTASPKHSAAGFNTVCQSCHNTTQWKGAQFDHNTQTTFALSGAHRTATCAACHSDNVFKGKPTTCLSCHQPQYAATVTPPHVAANFATTCQTCHTTTQWRGANFDHTVTKFPLTGAHKAQVCANCHADKVYVGKSTLCVSCHQAVYAASKNPPHGAAGFSTVCQSCHTTVQWAGATFDHNTTQFPLTGSHKPAACASCHGDGIYKGKPTTCVSCHQAKYTATSNPPHAKAGFPTLCATCHNTTQWAGAVFDHNATNFALTGAHKAAACAGCHGDGVYTGKPTACASCHQADYTGTTNPNHKQSGFSTICQSCHNTTQWQGAVFNHDLTKFPLTGAHKVALCANCHGDGVYAGKPTACATCHQTDYNGTTNPNHKAAGYPTTCQTCHTTTQWLGAPFDHNKTLFPLTGQHKVTLCANCHADGVYKGKPTACVSCHLTKYNATTTPAHKPAGFPTICENCHTTTQWLGAVFDHGKTLFPLTGQHKVATCNDCHSDGVFKGKPTACVSCHQTEYNGTTTPNHKAAGFPTLCQSCHTTTQWTGAVFDHNATQFPLTGAHKVATCNNCHSDGVYNGKPTACVTCHQTEYNGTTTPNHKAAGFSTTCQTCHTTTVWTGAVFDHNATLFPLTGAHKTATCNNCHSDGVYKGKPTACVTCHQTDYNGTTTPNHKTLGFPVACDACHTTTQWLGAVFDHNATLFPLTGAHKVATCQGCHSDGVYKGKPTTCISCHTPDYNATKKPPHAASSIPTTCQSCHTTVQWLGGTYNHSVTAFPLTGAHQAATCNDCHGTGIYKGTPTTCINCHNADWSASTNPHHSAAGFVTTCQTCHTTVQWKGGTYNHSATAFPLTGAHVAQTCISCHASKVYKGLPSTCVSCHLTDYNTTTNPKHATAMFPTTCNSCHTTVQWLGATFNHDGAWFPIYSGKHLAKWTRCTDCHNNSSDFKVFTCLTCHPHSDKTKTDGDHRGKSGYAYTSAKCYACHPKGRA